MRKLLLKNRDLLESLVLAHVLPFIAGAVNASGFFIVGAYTSHVTGSVARVGDDLVEGDISGALQAAGLVLSFYLGAVSATALLEGTARRSRSHYARPLATEALTLLAVALLGMGEAQSVPHLRFLATVLLCFAMGIQNALVTRLSGAIVRTTHLTGIVTDMGIETIHAYRWLKGGAGDRGAAALASKVLRARAAPELARLRLHSAILLAFLVGALVGPYLYLRHGFASMFLPIAVLLLLAALDVAIGLRARERPPSNEIPQAVPQGPAPSLSHSPHSQESRA